MVRKYEAYFDNNKIVLNDDIADIDSLYVYKSLNEKMFSFDINSIERVENHAIIYVKNEDETIKNRLLGIVRLEIVENSQSLFELIFLRAGVKINE